MFIFFLFLLISNSDLFPVAIPANGLTATSRQTAALFPRTDSNNQILGFGAFEAGFSLGNGGTSCLYSAFYPVGGFVDLRDGTLNLQYDILFDETTNFFSAGTINGNGASVQMPSLTGSLPLVNSPTLDFIAANARNATVPSIDWSFDSQYVAAVSTTPILSTLLFNGSTLTQASILTLGLATGASSVRWHPTTDNIAVAQTTTGALAGFAIQVYTFSRLLGTLVSLVGAELGVIILNSPSASAVAWRPDGNFLAASLTAGINLGVRVYSFGLLGILTFVSGDATNTTVQNNALDWKDNTYLAAGNSAGTNQLKVYTFNGTTLATSINVNVGQTVSAVQWSNTSNNFLAVGLSSGTNRLAIYRHDPVGVTLTLQAASLIGETVSVLSVDWSPNGNNLAVGLALSSGRTEVRVYSVNQSTAALTLVAQVNADFNTNSYRWSPSGSYVATGDGGNYVTVYTPTVAPFTFNATKVTLRSDLSLQNMSSLIFSGACEVEGNNFTIDLTNISSFTIAANSSLLLKNVELVGISGLKISADSTSVLSLRNVKWVQNGDYVFANGAFNILDSVLLTGTSTFVYSSSRTSTIQANSVFNFDSGMTFSYAPPTNARNLLQMIDSSSQLYLLNTSLYSTTTGLQLTKGTLIIDGLTPVISSATSQVQGIMFGDGASAANNLTVKVLPESGLNLNSGFLIYNNV
jgi:hypothetical protein